MTQSIMDFLKKRKGRVTGSYAKEFEEKRKKGLKAMHKVKKAMKRRKS